MSQLLKRLAAQLPSQWLTELKRIYYRLQILSGSFFTNEPEYKILERFVTPGDWVIDVGANVGHYTKRFSELVGIDGRVIAFEPVPTTFSLLSTNAQMFDYPNVTLVNAAVSNRFGVVGMTIPKHSTKRQANYYRAYLSQPSFTNQNALSVLTISLDSLQINQRISLVKIDVEGHESFVLAGMQNLIDEHRPVLIVETCSRELVSNLTKSGYTPEVLQDSPNVIFRALPNDIGDTASSSGNFRC